MASTGSGYDLSSTTFSPDGRIYQVEYAGKAVDNSGTVIGIKCSDGILLGVERVLLSHMMVAGGANRRVVPVDLHCGMADAGLVADGRQLVNRARHECREWKKNYGEKITVEVLARHMANYVHMHTCYWAYRPFGSALLVGGYDLSLKEFQLYTIEPNGTVQRCHGAAIGKGRSTARTEIEKIDLSATTCAEALKMVSKILTTTRGEEHKNKPTDLEMSWCTEATGYKFQKVPVDVVKEAKAWSTAEILREEMGSDDDEDDDDDEDVVM